MKSINTILYLVQCDLRERYNIPNPMDVDDRFHYYIFPQLWPTTALGFDDGHCVCGQAFTEAYTVVVMEGVDWSLIQAHVYFSGEYAYTVFNPNSIFLDNLLSMKMKSVSNKGLYEEPN